MSTWYKTSTYSINIEPVEVVSETQAFVTVLESSFRLSGANVPRKERRRKDNDYHRTFAEARSFLLNRNHNNFISHQQSIERLRAEASVIFMMEPPKEGQ